MLQQFYDVAPDMIQGGPKFMDGDRWDITGEWFQPTQGSPRKAIRRRELS